MEQLEQKQLINILSQLGYQQRGEFYVGVDMTVWFNPEECTVGNAYSQYMRAVIDFKHNQEIHHKSIATNIAYFQKMLDKKNNTK